MVYKYNPQTNYIQIINNKVFIVESKNVIIWIIKLENLILIKNYLVFNI